MLHTVISIRNILLNFELSSLHYNKTVASYKKIPKFGDICLFQCMPVSALKMVQMIFVQCNYSDT